MVLSNVDLIWSRVEEYKGAKFDVVMARAVAHVEVLIPWMLQIMKKKGKLVLYKEKKTLELGPAARDGVKDQSLDIDQKTEHEVLVELCRKYKLRIEKEHKYVLEGSELERVVYVLG